MRNEFKLFLVSILLLSAIGAVAQTATANGQTVAAQEKQTASSTAVDQARLNKPADLFMNHLQNDGPLDHAFMKVITNFAPTHTVSTAAISLCKPGCTGGLVCCDCTVGPRCETETVCKLQCSE